VGGREGGWEGGRASIPATVAKRSSTEGKEGWREEGREGGPWGNDG
jgi:hypothetical protein